MTNKAQSFTAPDPELAQRLLEHAERHSLYPEIARSRIERMVEVALRRIGSVTLAIENLWDTHNVSAILRSAEGLGLTDLHVVEHPQRFKKHRGITHGADRWLTVHRYTSTEELLRELNASGFRICAADVGPGCISVTEVPVDRPLALIMGSEKHGLGDATRDHADLRFSIPMTGFTGSFNVSVSAAVALFEITRRRRLELGRAGDLTPGELERLIGRWIDLNTTAGKKRANRPGSGKRRIRSQPATKD